MEKATRWLNAKEAEYLGFDPKPNEKGRTQARYQLTETQWREVLQLFRAQNDHKNVSETPANEYNGEGLVLSAWDDEGRMMDIDKYCEYYSLPKASIDSYKLVSHTGTPFYNIVFKEEAVSEVDLDFAKKILERELTKDYAYAPIVKFSHPREAVMKWSDLHFGAHIRNLLRTQDYDSDVLYSMLMDSVEEVNRMGFRRVHIHILGDLIESFTGLNHVNSWLSLNKDETGANAIQMCTRMLHKVLSQIHNLGQIKIVAGNHDRLSKNNDEDVKGGAAELIAWGLDLIGYDVEFNPVIIRQKVEGINHLGLHGHLGLSKLPTEKILWKYGEKGCYNYISEGHLHSVIQKLSVAQRKNFETLKDDSVDHRRSHVASFFPGNFYSESGGWDSNPGYEIIWDNGKGRPNVFQGSTI